MAKARRENIAAIVSVLALLLSGLSLWLSLENRKHHRVVEWEQKRQEARRLMSENESLLNQLAEESRNQLRSNEDADLRETAAREWMASREFGERARRIVARLDLLPATPETDSRVMLEGVVGEIHLLNDDLRTEVRRLKNLTTLATKELDE